MMKIGKHFKVLLVGLIFIESFYLCLPLSEVMADNQKGKYETVKKVLINSEQTVFPDNNGSMRVENEEEVSQDRNGNIGKTDVIARIAPANPEQTDLPQNDGKDEETAKTGDNLQRQILLIFLTAMQAILIYLFLRVKRRNLKV